MSLIKKQTKLNVGIPPQSNIQIISQAAEVKQKKKKKKTPRSNSNYMAPCLLALEKVRHGFLAPYLSIWSYGTLDQCSTCVKYPVCMTVVCRVYMS
jgi:hypothetical protein